MLWINKDRQHLLEVKKLLQDNPGITSDALHQTLNADQKAALYRYTHLKQIRSKIDNNVVLTDSERVWLCKVFGVENTIDHWGTVLGLYEYMMAYEMINELGNGENLDEHGTNLFHFNSNLGLFFGFQCALSFVASCYIPFKEFLSESARLHALIHLEQSIELRFKQELLAEARQETRLTLINTAIEQISKQKSELEKFIKEQNIMLKSGFLDGEQSMLAYESLHDETTKNSMNLLLVYQKRLDFLNDLKERFTPSLFTGIKEVVHGNNDSRLQQEIQQEKKDISRKVNNYLHQPLYDSVYVDHDTLQADAHKDAIGENETEIFKNYSVRGSTGLYHNLIDLISQRLAYETEGNDNWIYNGKKYVENTKLKNYFNLSDSKHVQDVFAKSRERAHRNQQDLDELVVNSRDNTFQKDGQLHTINGKNTYYSESVQAFHKQKKRETYYLERSIKQTIDKIKVYEGILASINADPNAKLAANEDPFNELTLDALLKHLDDDKNLLNDKDQNKNANEAEQPIKKNVAFIHQVKRLDTQIGADWDRRGYRILDYFKTTSKGLGLIFSQLLKPRNDIESSWAYAFYSFLHNSPKNKAVNLIRYPALLTYFIFLAPIKLFTFTWYNFGYLLKKLQFSIDTMHKGVRNIDEALTFKDGEFLTQVPFNIANAFIYRVKSSFKIVVAFINACKNFDVFNALWYLIKFAITLPFIVLYPLYQLTKPLFKIVLAAGYFIPETLGGLFYFCLGPFAQDNNAMKTARAITPGFYAAMFERLYLHVWLNVVGYLRPQQTNRILEIYMSQWKRAPIKALAAFILYHVINLPYYLIATVFYCITVLPGAIINIILTPVKRIFHALWSYMGAVVKAIGWMLINIIDRFLSFLGLNRPLGQFFNWLGKKVDALNAKLSIFPDNNKIDKARAEVNRGSTLIRERSKAFWTRRLYDPFASVSDFYRRDQDEIDMLNKFGYHGKQGNYDQLLATDYFMRGTATAVGAVYDAAEALGTTPILATLTALTISNLAPGFGWSMSFLEKLHGAEHGFNWTFSTEQAKNMYLSAFILDTKNGLQDIYNITYNQNLMEARKILEEPVFQYQAIIRERAKPRNMSYEDNTRKIYIVLNNKLLGCDITERDGVTYLTYANSTVAKLTQKSERDENISAYDPSCDYEIQSVVESTSKPKLMYLSGTSDTAEKQYASYQIQLKENESELHLRLPKIPMSAEQVKNYIENLATYQESTTTNDDKNALDARHEKRSNRLEWTNEYIACQVFVQQGKDIFEGFKTANQNALAFLTDESNTSGEKSVYEESLEHEMAIQYKRMQKSIENHDHEDILAHTMAYAVIKTGEGSALNKQLYNVYYNYFKNSKTLKSTLAYFYQMFGIDDFCKNNQDPELKNTITRACLGFSESMASQLLNSMNTVRANEELERKQYAKAHPDRMPVCAVNKQDANKYYIKRIEVVKLNGIECTFELWNETANAKIADLQIKDSDKIDQNNSNLENRYDITFIENSKYNKGDFYYYTPGNNIDLGLCLDALEKDFPKVINKPNMPTKEINKGQDIKPINISPDSASAATHAMAPQQQRTKEFYSSYAQRTTLPDYKFRQKTGSRAHINEQYEMQELNKLKSGY